MHTFATHTHMHTYTPHIHAHTPTHTQNASKVARKQYCPGLCNNKSLINDHMFANSALIMITGF